jgi:hypothetical protein
VRGRNRRKEADVIAQYAVAIFLPILMVCIFSFVSIASWAEARRKEREAFYHAEAIKKIAESPAGGATAALELMREQERVDHRRRRESQKLGGLVTLAVGTGLGIFLRGIEHDVPVYLVGLIPAGAGLALLVYAFFLSERD